MKIIDTKTIIIHLLKKEHKVYLSLSRIRDCIAYIYDELVKRNELNNYKTYFEVNFEAIERTVLYNSNIFKLDVYAEMIYLRDKVSVESLAIECSIDENIDKIINDFINNYAV